MKQNTKNKIKSPTFKSWQEAIEFGVAEQIFKELDKLNFAPELVSYITIYKEDYEKLKKKWQKKN